jgi:adenylate cyclase, class 2
MPKPAQYEEIEIKLRVQSVDTLRSQLKRLRAREISPRTHESNTLYDTPQKDLRRRGQLIRIRIEQPASNFGRKRPKQDEPAVLTYKGTSPASRSARRTRTHPKLRSHFKIKEETEVSLAGAHEMARILRALGFHPVFRYEKFRTTHALPGIHGLKIELDETPVGIFLELEGPPLAINRAARLLGYTPQDYLKATYGALYLTDCRKRGRKPGNMLFPPRKKLH